MIVYNIILLLLCTGLLLYNNCSVIVIYTTHLGSRVYFTSFTAVQLHLIELYVQQEKEQYVA